MIGVENVFPVTHVHDTKIAWHSKDFVSLSALVINANMAQKHAVNLHFLVLPWFAVFLFNLYFWRWMMRL
jgi:hypothetical protein